MHEFRKLKRDNINIKEFSLERLDISTRLFVFLKNFVGIKTLNELSEKTEAEIEKIPACNPHLMKELKSIMFEKYINFKE